MTPIPITNNTLFYGDNLPILREHIADQSVDLVYLDPPFNSKRTYNVLFKDESGSDAEAQLAAFDDTWHSGRGGVVEREKAAIGVLLTLEPSTGAMEQEAVTAGFYRSPGWGQDYPRIQILTVEALLGGAKIQMPMAEWGTFKQAQKVAEEKGVQGKLL